MFLTIVLTQKYKNELITAGRLPENSRDRHLWPSMKMK